MKLKCLCDSCIHEKVCRLPPLPTEWCSDYKYKKGDSTMSEIKEKYLSKFTECSHKESGELIPECIHCNFAWCLERINVLESREAKLKEEIEQRIAQVHWKNKEIEHLEEEDNVKKLQRRLNELESQLCGAKKKRMDGLESRLIYLEGFLKPAIDDLKMRIKAIEEREKKPRHNIPVIYGEPKDSKREAEQVDVIADMLIDSGAVTVRELVDYFKKGHPERFEDEPKREPWKPKDGCPFWFVNINMDGVSKAPYWSTGSMHNSINCFQTCCEAERFLEIIKRAKEDFK